MDDTSERKQEGSRAREQGLNQMALSTLSDLTSGPAQSDQFLSLVGMAWEDTQSIL